jgi:demethylmenaquinone methyltransferase/2-methoxy-6-polyprenyl-1,4-benzoquinol methylase
MYPWYVSPSWIKISEMFARRPRGYWHLPALLYDLAFSGMFQGLRRYVARAVDKDGLYPWLDVCSGTGAQLRVWSRERARGLSRGHVPSVRVPVLGSDIPSAGAPDLRRDAGESGRPTDQVLGLDLSFGFVRYAAARAPGVPFVCGDAARLPFKDGSVRAVSISFGLHDKSPDFRGAILEEARRALGPNGRLIAVDFENPWDARSRLGALFVRAVERLATREHYRNGRAFLRSGGLRGLLRTKGFVEVSRRDVAAGSLGIIIARPAR